MGDGPAGRFSVTAAIEEARDAEASITRSSEEAERRRLQAAYARRSGAAPARDALWDPGNLFMIQERDRHAIALLRRHGMTPLRGRRILEIGCGSGRWIRRFVDWGADPADIVGVDLLPDRVEAARRRCPPAVTLRCGSGTDPAVVDGGYDLVVQSTVFTSVLDEEMRAALAGRMLEALRPGGIVLWYDFLVDNPRNPDVRGVRRGEIGRLFPGCEMDLRRITLAPPLARRLARVSWTLCVLLSRLPFLCTHYLGVIRKPGP